MPPLQPNSSSAVNSLSPGKAEGIKASGSTSSEEFSIEERAMLLRLAHNSISSALQHHGISLESPLPHFAKRRGAFSSLYLRGELRGCVGYVLPNCSLYRVVAETARAAAFDDNRFSPVTAEEEPHLEIELSILSRPQPIAAEEVEVGRHGLLISLHGRRGLLLPQVPAEHGWDSITFLEQTCRKAGLPLDAWHSGAIIEAFTAEVFGRRNIQPKLLE